jgi:hypothetical protein
MTAFVLSEDEMKEMKADTGVDHIINKPLPEFNELKQILEDIIEQKKQEQQTQNRPEETKQEQQTQKKKETDDS